MPMFRLFVLLATLLALPAHAAETLKVYNWSEYMPQRVLDLFTNQTGITITYVTYESNEEMYEQVKANPSEYDIVVPSTYFVSRMAREGMLQKINKSKLPNIGNLDPRLMNLAHDPQNEYSIPYLWGTTAMFVDSAHVKTKLTSWADLWRPEFRNKVLLLDDMRDIFHIALRTLGYSGSSTNPKEIEAAYRKLLELKPNIVEFNSDSPKDAILEDRAELGAIWNGEIFRAGEERYTVECIYPKEGAVMWVDSFAIPAGSKNSEAAHKFIDFLMKPGIAALAAEAYGYATPNRAAMKELDLWTRGSPVIYPSDEILKKASIHVDLGDATAVYEKYWKLFQEAK